jgi:hypothetical protein
VPVACATRAWRQSVHSAARSAIPSTAASRAARSPAAGQDIGFLGGRATALDTRRVLPWLQPEDLEQVIDVLREFDMTFTYDEDEGTLTRTGGQSATALGDSYDVVACILGYVSVPRAQQDGGALLWGWWMVGVLRSLGRPLNGALVAASALHT